MEGGTPRKHRSLEDRIRIYGGTKDLRSRGKTYPQIAAELGISLDEVGYWLRANPPHVQRYIPDLTPRPELAYLVGAYLGDGRTAGPNDKKVRFHVADAAFAKILNELTAAILRTQPRKVTVDSGFLSVVYDSAALYDYLQQPVGNLVPLVEAFPEKFLQGFFDAEGYVTQSINATAEVLLSMRVGVANANPEYLVVVEGTLRSLGISSRTRVTNRAGQVMVIRGRAFSRKRDVQHIEIFGRRSLELFHSRVGFLIPYKRDKLRNLISLMELRDPAERFTRFTSMYEKRGRKWLRMEKKNDAVVWQRE